MNKAKYIAIAAITLDGKIAKDKNHMSDWTSKEDKVFMRALLDKCGVIIVGNNTYKTAIKPLSKRNCLVLTKQVPSPGLGRARERSNAGNPQYVNPNKTNLKKLITKLKYRKVAILGGAQTYAYCLKNNILDELYLTIEPLVFGKGINLFGDDSLNKNFKLISTKKLNNKGSLLLKYKKL
nr:RibD C-terminal domain protein [uncultured bacterium]